MVCIFDDDDDDDGMRRRRREFEEEEDRRLSARAPLLRFLFEFLSSLHGIYVSSS